MSFNATVYRVMIASPGDVQAERDIVRDVVHEWNAVNAIRRGIVLLPVGWETDLAPEMGDAPQTIIDKRILKDADLLVGIFWTRIGTPTANYASGAVEEIEEHLAAKKPAMLYFSMAPAVLDSVDPDQYKGLKAFRDSCKSRGVYDTYSNTGDFRHKLSTGLQITLNSDLFGGSGERPLAANNAISQDAAKLLKAASSDGTIMFERFGGGVEVSANGQVFNENSDARTVAKWESVIEELEKAGFVKATSERREVFEVTQAGFTAADSRPGEERPTS
jgi:hypothetical protein